MLKLTFYWGRLCQTYRRGAQSKDSINMNHGIILIKLASETWMCFRCLVLSVLSHPDLLNH